MFRGSNLHLYTCACVQILRQVNLHCSESLNEEEFSLPFVKLRYKGSDPARLSTFSFLAPEFPLGHSDEQDLINRDSESIAGAGAGAGTQERSLYVARYIY